MKKLYEEEKIRAIAEQIRKYGDTTKTFNTDNMPVGVQQVYENAYSKGQSNIEGSLGAATFTSNGEYNASSYDLSGFKKVTVDVPSGITPSGEIEITENGTYDVTEFASVKVNVQSEGGGVDYSAQFVEGTLTEYENDEITSIRQNAFSFLTNLKSVKLPNLTSIPGEGFRSCSSLEVIYAPLITSIGFQTFYTCTSLETVDFPNLSSINTSCFYGCEKLKKLDLGVSPSVSPQSMRYCSSLETVILRRQILATMSSTNALEGTPIESGTGYIYVPRDLVDSYKVATNWSTYADQIRAIEDYPEITGG